MLAGTCAQAGALLVPVAEALTERSWLVEATCRRDDLAVFASCDGSALARWGLWVFLGRTPAAS